ncbi:hypothetical protein, conserved [Entamoeba dispar SAW760]|uniref:Uncharacterized protein n=1 Tax=Entamoeba dispar (strain ATCC PRA-260 / SAW760) TaxID=370354 RepID=B0E7P0_ENTDS|nr:uncharacterized protein EDI_220370 [Entamoeba dispar SAW760]EDR29448.1 hypothetical protein, conserved [Entamoeba dispar SAW760]|eukprot:EDR29448.1 hypothetical protein, conserved [Entamoeba dispar SAW760]
MDNETHRFQELIPLIHTFDGKSIPPKPNKIVRPWKKEEDELLLQAVEEFGTKRWHLVAQRIPNRTRKQCRERYCNHLDPDIIKVPWTEKEDQILKEAKALYGNRWTLIKMKLPGRTANQVKNRYFAKFSDVDEKEKREPKIMSAFTPVNKYLFSICISNKYY